ncbi:hypothetical protein [Mycolicibacterium holsaticum]|nr:hypothetical protein [Mycolicibacterium holsaticum]QZA14426.1 hypothetical protein K3U96_10140 [Mycolicibacterium holsaticum DSM 44478 = JCM 12374]UNC08124.1 hypothetical protein H5U41_16690 [Mycolicibacterium holsaticum DSM 44478 = JCM 12374]
MFASTGIAIASVASAAPVSDAKPVCSLAAVCHQAPAGVPVWAPGTGPAADAADDAFYASGIEYQ